MNLNEENSRLNDGPRLTQHEEYIKLCALSTCGALTSEEQTALNVHLRECAACSEALREFQNIAQNGMAALGSEFVPELPASSSISPTEESKKKFSDKLRMEQDLECKSSPGFDSRNSAGKLDRIVITKLGRSATASSHQDHSWIAGSHLRYAAGVLLIFGLTAVAYRLGQEKTAGFFRANTHASEMAETGDRISLQQQVSFLMHERQGLTDQLSKKDQIIESLTNQLSLQTQEVREKEKSLQDVAVKTDKEKSQITSDRENLLQELKVAQANLAKTRDELDATRQARTTDLLHATNLETHIVQLSERLKEQDDTVLRQEEYLNSDRDIRDLMGARNLYIAEVYDVEHSGTKKPFGRVFFTKNKSLIFYAYDLDQQPGVNNASAFQAWGCHAADRKRAVNLGIFFMDQANDKRWVLKFDDPKTLQQIDSVFVSVEPNGGSPKPSGNQLLFAYLRMEPNHP